MFTTKTKNEVKKQTFEFPVCEKNKLLVFVWERKKKQTEKQNKKKTKEREKERERERIHNLAL